MILVFPRLELGERGKPRASGDDPWMDGEMSAIIE